MISQKIKNIALLEYVEPSKASFFLLPVFTVMTYCLKKESNGGSSLGITAVAVVKVGASATLHVIPWLPWLNVIPWLYRALTIYSKTVEPTGPFGTMPHSPGKHPNEAQRQC